MQAISPIQSQSIQTTFQAKWPDALNSPIKKNLEVIWNIFSIVIFPIGLIRLARNYIKQKVLPLVIPGGARLAHYIPQCRNYIFNQLKGTSIQLITPDQKKLDGVFFRGEQKDKAIILTFGNASQFELTFEKLEDLLPLQASIIMVNPRGIGESEGPRDEKNCALDIYTVYQYLIEEEGIDPNNIVLYGESLGAALGTMGAAFAQKQYPNKKINVINCRSFSTLQKEIEQIFQESFNWIVGQIVRLAAKSIGLEMDAKGAWDTLKGEKILFYSSKDEIIRKEASLYEAIKKDPSFQASSCYAMDVAHNDDFPSDARDNLHMRIRQILNLANPNASVA